jgi:hypothetical protein
MQPSLERLGLMETEAQERTGPAFPLVLELAVRQATMAGEPPRLNLRIQSPCSTRVH